MRAGFVDLEAKRKHAEPIPHAGGPAPMSDTPATTDEWNAGDLACGELVIELRKKLRRIPGEVLKVTATDSSAPIDLPAWCRLTNNTLVHHDAASKSFWIRSRTNWT